MNLQIQTPCWAKPILDRENARYIGAFGGRGSGKSWFFAEWIIERCVMQKTNVVCVREVQKSLKQSVKKLIENKIEEFGIGHLFEVQQTEIKCPHGGVIIFAGMQNHTADSIKSLEGFDIAWVEEAQSISQFSLDLLRPTIRKPGSQMLFSWNPRFDTDPIEGLLRGPGAPPDSIVVEVNYTDNPWFPDVLRQEMEYDKRRDPDKYLHVWKGEYVRNSETRVFKNWTIEDFEAPADAVHRFGADWGFASDPTVLVRCHIIGRKLYIDHEAYRVGCEIVDTPALFMSVPDAERWPMVADSARPETISHMRKNGFPKILAAVKGPKSVEEGVEWLKSFDIVVHPRCKHLVDEMTLYSYKTDPDTDKVLPILADKHNHCIAEGELVACERGLVPIEHVTTSDRVLTRGGYQRVLFADVTDVDRETLIVETTNGVVRCTPDHEIWTVKGFVRADALRYDDEVLTLETSSWSKSLSGTERGIAGILKAGTQQAKRTFSAAKEAAQAGCTVMFGSMNAGQYRMAGTFTTSMETRQTMTSQILSAFRQSNTPSDTFGMMSASGGRLSISTKSGTQQNLGTLLMRVAQSIERSAHWLMLRLPQSQSHASIAALLSRHERLATKTGSAQTSASLHGGENLGWMTKHARAKSAEAHSLSTNTASSKLVPGRVVTVRAAGRCERVYDLTVENHHEFVAGGVLVSNCIDALRYACEGARRASTQVKPKANPVPVLMPMAR